MNKYITIAAGVIALFCCSCKKFLTQYPETQASTGTFYQTQSDFNAAVVACYSALRSHPGTELFPLVEYRSDNMFVKSYTSGSQDQYMINKFTDNSANSLIAAAWTDMFQGIFYCNQVISRIGGAAITDAAIRNQYEGEARFIRALYYFQLVRFYGGVPLADHPVDATEALTIPRSPIADVYAFIENDLTRAATLLPETYASTDLGRARASAAKALLAKVYLTEGRYTNAQGLLKDLIGNANTLGYQLVPAVANVFSISNEMNSEVMFAIRFNKSSNGGGHSAWFSIADTTISELNSTLTRGYNAADARANLLRYTKSGTVFYLNKYADSPDATTKNLGNDFIVLRYADVLLMYAECLNATAATLSTDSNDPNGALYWLNQVRTRSYPAGAVTASQYADKTGLAQLIWQERKLEFPLEGNRWFDLQRTGTAATVLNAYNITVPDYRLIYPVPNAEVEKINNASIFPQNPKY